MSITAEQVNTLRGKTGAGFMQCKKALEESSGDVDKAVDLLRKMGAAAAEKKVGRTAGEGMIYSYIHPGARVGVLLEVNCETDFVARTEEFQELVRDIAMHIAAAEPRYVERGEVTAEILEREKAIYRDQALASGKPANVVEKIVEGKMEKFYAEAVLLEQPFVKDTDTTIGQMITAKVAKIGENIKVRRFSRFKLGEGIEKVEKDFAAEVAGMTQG